MAQLNLMVVFQHRHGGYREGGSISTRMEMSSDRTRRNRGKLLQGKCPPAVRTGSLPGPLGLPGCRSAAKPQDNEAKSVCAQEILHAVSCLSWNSLTTAGAGEGVCVDPRNHGQLRAARHCRRSETRGPGYSRAVSHRLPGGAAALGRRGAARPCASQRPPNTAPRPLSRRSEWRGRDAARPPLGPALLRPARCRPAARRLPGAGHRRGVGRSRRCYAPRPGAGGAGGARGAGP